MRKAPIGGFITHSNQPPSEVFHEHTTIVTAFQTAAKPGDGLGTCIVVLCSLTSNLSAAFTK